MRRQWRAGIITEKLWVCNVDFTGKTPLNKKSRLTQRSVFSAAQRQFSQLLVRGRRGFLTALAVPRIESVQHPRWQQAASSVKPRNLAGGLRRRCPSHPYCQNWGYSSPFFDLYGATLGVASSAPTTTKILNLVILGWEGFFVEGNITQKIGPKSLT